MNSRSVTEVKDSTKKHIRRRIETDFPNVLQIFPDNRGKLLLCPTCLSMVELANENRFQNRELETLKSVNVSHVVRSAMQMRFDIKKMKIKQTWPPCVLNVFKTTISFQYQSPLSCTHY